LLGLLQVPRAWSADDSDIQVQVQQRGRWIVVDVAMSVQATALDTWKVITDYDHMASFVSNLELSKIVDRVGDTLTVMQKGKASRGLLTFSFENVREVVLTPPREIHSRLISGDLEASEFTTRVVDHGASSEVINHGEFIPKIWVPPLIGPSVIAAETRSQFGQLRAEILRRKGQSPTAGHP
jgi:hypothetical protein